MAKDIRLGIVGFGEVGSGFGKGLKGAGLTAISAFDKFWNHETFGSLIQRRADEAGVKLEKDLPAMVRECDYLIVAVATAIAKEVALAIAPHLQAGQVYVDVSSSSPKLKAELDAIISATGATFADVAIVGPLPVFGHRVAMLACGQGAAGFKADFTPFGMNITDLGLKVGQASAIKMFRSIFMKGIEALFLEMLLAAEQYDAGDQVLASIAETLESTPFPVSANRYVTGDAIHAGRRVHEMEGVIATLEEMGFDPIMSRATRERLAWSASLGLREHFGGQTPKSYKEVMKAIEAALAKGKK